ncbi:unnamed protein product [Ranitomeya imitator]|uniref:Uncharacterized protein n=1 Tax=Ranitomeya imitator TaxID=111125 RepID=A0ABN9KZK1_9NEOB|nr:unnamed protein product [Ranitomeya imitator]
MAPERPPSLFQSPHLLLTPELLRQGHLAPAMTGKGPTDVLSAEVSRSDMERRELVQKRFKDVASTRFAQFEKLSYAATHKIEDISHKQKKDAEAAIALQFEMEKIIYCQDTLYCEAFSVLKSTDKDQILHDLRQLTIKDACCHLEAYFKFRKKLHYEMIRLLEERNQTDLLEEKDGRSGDRKRLKDQIRRLKMARERLQRFSHSN